MAKKDEVEQSIKEAVKKVELEPSKTSEAYLRQMVPIKLYKDKDHKKDAFVRVNGETFLIQRGVQVMIPRYVLEVLENQEAMQNLAVERMEELQNKAREAQKAFM